MIRIENVEIYGWEAAIRGARSPMNSWVKSDSYKTYIENEQTGQRADFEFFVGDEDLKLMQKLVKAGTDHRKFMRMITVYVDVTAPLYWWKEADTYKVGTVRNSCSTMHKITEKEFTLDDFSREHLFTADLQLYQINDLEEETLVEIQTSALEILNVTIQALNRYRKLYLETNYKRYWHQLIQLLPSSYNQRATVMLNYEVLANMYHARKNHKLDEWCDFCRWIESLPYSELITGGKDEQL